MTDRRRMLATLAGGILLARLPGGVARAEGGQEAELVRLLNELRRARTLNPLAEDVALIRAAEGHAAELARRGELDHVSEDGSSLGARIARTGFRYRLAAENLASGPSSAREVFDLWLRSDTHRHNMLRPRLTHCGVGRVQVRAPGILGAKKSWWVLVLAERL
ncbi:MAG: CAP domain-containing protein [Alphaproteobacteria bacterium]|nr:CAP domain-containing protein [Alphaproteobacteria bacterium]